MNFLSFFSSFSEAVSVVVRLLKTTSPHPRKWVYFLTGLFQIFFSFLPPVIGNSSAFFFFLLFNISVFLFGVCYSLRIRQLQVPSVIDVRDKAVLNCTFDLEGDRLYSVKWYKEEDEFFRYMPGLSPHIQTFVVQGVNLVVSCRK